jgi:long-chain acyl-CoA synthetase
MALADQLIESLKTWQRYPCFIELAPKRNPRAVFADQLIQDIDAFSESLKKWGICRGCPVPIFLDNSIDFVVAFLGLQKLGAVPVMAKMEYGTVELDEIFKNASPAAVITESRQLTKLSKYLADITVVQHENNRFRIAQRSKPRPERLSEEIATINYTYRGYGYPLGAMIPQGQYCQGAEGFQNCLLSKPGDKILALLPMQHIFTLVSAVFFPLLNQLTSLIVRTMHPRYLFEYANQYRAEFITTVPAVFSMLLRLSEEACSMPSEVFVSGGSRLSVDLYNRLRERFKIELLNGYGLTEYTPATGNIRGLSRSGTIGRPCPGVDLMIHDPDDKGIGEIWLKSKRMCSGYYRRDRETGESFVDGWFKTGDLGKASGDHVVFVAEKKKTRKVNGNIVDLKEIECALGRNHRIREAEVWGEQNQIKARIRLRSTSGDSQLERSGIRAQLRGLIADYKIPATIEIV